ncbi:S-adenosyl-L-methionine-dependent methyltransferase [Xylariaceae sp. FL1651]|nr:S-adenosyl-L-methionine-dependent methyltransferase [Xylariaceae sp. FL1651]
MAQPRIVELSTCIASNTAKLNEYLNTNLLPTPSFDVSRPLDNLAPKSETDVEQACVAIIEDTVELQFLVLGPREYVMNSLHDDLLSLQAITQASFSSIATFCGLSKPTIRQIIRHAMMNIFCEPRPRVVAHNAKAAAHARVAWEKYPNSGEPNETSVFEVFDQDTERARKFGNTMRSFTQRTGLELRHVVDSISWSDSKDGTIVDVGGSHRDVAFAVVRACPSLSCIVQDLESIVASEEKVVPSDVVDRPVHGADVYFFRWIFHNWLDKYCVAILRNLIPTLKPSGSIIINDGALPSQRMISKWQEKKLRYLPIIQNAHERDLED